MQIQRENELVMAYRQMSGEDQVAILAIAKDRAKANAAKRPHLRLIATKPSAERITFSHIAGSR